MIRDAETKREAAGAVLGTIAADIAGDGMRNIWWFINAPQALTQVATRGHRDWRGQDGAAADRDSASEWQQHCLLF